MKRDVTEVCDNGVEHLMEIGFWRSGRIDLRELGCEVMTWIERDHVRALVVKEMNLRDRVFLNARFQCNVRRQRSCRLRPPESNIAATWAVFTETFHRNQMPADSWRG